MDYYAGNGLAISGNLPKRKELVGPLAEMERDYKRFKAVDEEHFNGEGYESEEEEEDNVPNPYAVSNFRISDVVARQLKSKGIETLFPIQALTFDAIYEGNDLVGRAHTGQGKTLAFVLPILESLMKSGAWNSQKRKKGRAPSVLILAPTRELAKQVHDDFEFYGSVIGISTVCVYGGAPYPPQAAAMRAGVDVVVGTPGRIKDHLERGTLNLKMLKFRILDEADEMLNMGFVDDVEKILGHVEDASSVQTLLFSATMPDWVQKIASRFLKDTKEVVDLVGDEKMKACASVRHLLLPCLKSARNQLVMDVISCYSSGGRTIVFTERKNEASDLAGILPGTARALHGDIPQSQREVTLSGFRSGKFSILVATDVAARGLDITDVQLIIQCEPPKDAESYIHRSGRTGRAGKTGISVMFYSKKKEHLIPIIEKKAGFKFEKISAPQPADLARASATGAAESIMAVSDGVLPIFRPAAEDLVQKSGLSLIDVVAKAIAKVAGHTELRRRSLLSGQEGFATMTLELGKFVHTLTFVFNALRRILPEASVMKVRGMALTIEGTGAVYDVPADLVDDFLAAAAKHNMDMKLLEILPPLQARGNRNTGRGGGTFGGRGGSIGRGGGFNTAAFGRGGGAFNGAAPGRGSGEFKSAVSGRGDGGDVFNTAAHGRGGRGFSAAAPGRGGGVSDTAVTRREGGGHGGRTNGGRGRASSWSYSETPSGGYGQSFVRGLGSSYEGLNTGDASIDGYSGTKMGGTAGPAGYKMVGAASFCGGNDGFTTVGGSNMARSGGENVFNVKNAVHGGGNEGGFKMGGVGPGGSLYNGGGADHGGSFNMGAAGVHGNFYKDGSTDHGGSCKDGSTDHGGSLKKGSAGLGGISYNDSTVGHGAGRFGTDDLGMRAYDSSNMGASGHRGGYGMSGATCGEYGNTDVGNSDWTKTSSNSSGWGAGTSTFYGQWQWGGGGGAGRGQTFY